MWFKIQNQQVKIQIVAKPHAKKTAIVKIDEQGLHVAIHAKPHKGEANKELILYLSELFQIPKSKIILDSGESSKYKHIIMPLTSKTETIINDLLILSDKGIK